jgi:ribosomal protein S12
MPTINQLVRKSRKSTGAKSKSPALHRVSNSLKTDHMKSRLLLSVVFA